MNIGDTKSLWFSHAAFNQALPCEVVEDRLTAVKFRVLSTKRFVWMPKKALSELPNLSGILNVKRWFTVEPQLQVVLDRYGNSYRK